MNSVERTISNMRKKSIITRALNITDNYRHYITLTGIGIEYDSLTVNGKKSKSCEKQTYIFYQNLFQKIRSGWKEVDSVK